MNRHIATRQGARGRSARRRAGPAATRLATPFLTAALALGAAVAEPLPEHMKPPPPRPAGEAASRGMPGPPAEAAAMPEAERACRARLLGLGAGFREHPPLDEPGGCGAGHPLTVDTLPGGVSLVPPAVMTCAMAEATALFVRDHAAPQAGAIFGSDLSAINQVSAYVCRNRRAGDRISEHARANALDWGSMDLADGTRIDITRYTRSEPRRARLIDRLRKAACGPFKTVLGPGSDPDHADHFHFDLAERRNGGTYCR